jgi:MFS family permease
LLNLKPYRTLFADKALRRIVLTSILPRLPAGINGLATTLMAQQLYSSFGIGGTVSAAYLVALGLASPIFGRLVDRNGPRPIIVPVGILHALAIAALVYAAHQRVSVPILMCFAFFAGASFPPVSMTVRAMWRKSDFPDNTKQLGFALEGVIMESVFVFGPLIVSGFLLVKSPQSALLFSAAMMLIGVILFSRSGAMERWGNVELGERHWLGPLKTMGVRRALMVSISIGATFGLQEIGMMAASKAANNEAAVGWLFAAFSIPSGIAGLLYGTRQFGWPLNRQMSIALVWISAFSLALTNVQSLWLFALGCAFCGAAVGPALTASQMQLGKLTPPEYSTEAFTWSMTLFMIALGGSFSIGGWIIDRFGNGAPMFAAFITAGLGALLCLRVPELYVAKERSE